MLSFSEENQADVAEALSIVHNDDIATDRTWEKREVGKNLDALQKFIAHLPGTSVLDVGCGWGQYAPDLNHAGLTYLGIDNAPQMIAACRQRYPGNKFTRMSFRQLQLPEESFAGIWCSYAFLTLPKSTLPAILQNLRQLLVPGAVIAITMPSDQDSFEDLAQETGAAEPLFWYSSYLLKELTDLLIDVGFSIVSAEEQFEAGAMSILARR